MPIPIAFAYGDLEIQDSVEWSCIVAGIVVVVLGALLPPKVVANVGFDLPFFLPDDD
jgi:hypothetical protein